MKNKLLYILILVFTLMFAGCGDGAESEDDMLAEIQYTSEPEILDDEVDEKQTLSQEDVQDINDSDNEEVDSEKYIINSDGMTLESRFPTPDGYERTDAKKKSLANSLRGYELKEDGAPVLLYDESEKGNQNAHAAVFKLPIEDADLQQCADSVMRVFAEYYWNTEQYEKIAFYFTNGFLCEYSKWMEGYRVVINGNDVSWSKEASYDDSYECFVKYMRTVFNYAGTLSMDSYESKTISLSDMDVGDVILKGGSPGHVVMVVDVCTSANGRKAFLLAQGYMPAQEFHVINNPLHETDPWYYEDEMTFPLNTAEYTFGDENMSKRLVY